LKQENYVVYVVDPDQAIADGLATLLYTYDIEVVHYPDAESFLDCEAAKSCNNCCLLVEANLPGMSGPALMHELRGIHVDLPVLLLIDTMTPAFVNVVNASGRIGVLEKPLANDALVSSILRLRRAA
jgi:FixJ family two-component response regulator